MSRQSVLVLTSSLLTDRMLWYSDFFHELTDRCDVTTWATAAGNPTIRGSWDARRVNVEPFPHVAHFRRFPHTYLRRVNEFAWDYRLRPPSRLSHRFHVEDRNLRLWVRAAKAPARVVASVGAERAFERWVQSLLQRYPRSPAAAARLQSKPPSLIVATGPMRFEEPGVIAVAKNMGIPTVALITSWDNLSTKKRMLFEYDGYFVWSEHMRNELHHFYPSTRSAPVAVIGAPQFDVFFNQDYHCSRAAFCDQVGLQADKPIVLYALGSPNLVREHHGAIELAQRVARGDLGDIQLLVRPHPVFDYSGELEPLRRLGPRVVLQHTGDNSAHQFTRSQARRQIIEWVNTFRHVNVIVNLASTVTIDAALVDCPIVNIDYDPEPGRPNQGLVNDANHLWTHFKPIAESGGVTNVGGLIEMMDAIKRYLECPELHRGERRWMVQHVCGDIDGHAGRRFARAVTGFTESFADRGANARWSAC